jgi:hypothetical protein
MRPGAHPVESESQFVAILHPAESLIHLLQRVTDTGPVVFRGAEGMTVAGYELISRRQGYARIPRSTAYGRRWQETRIRRRRILFAEAAEDRSIRGAVIHAKIVLIDVVYKSAVIEKVIDKSRSGYVWQWIKCNQLCCRGIYLL